MNAVRSQAVTTVGFWVRRVSLTGDVVDQLGQGEDAGRPDLLAASEVAHASREAVGRRRWHTSSTQLDYWRPVNWAQLSVGIALPLAARRAAPPPPNSLHPEPCNRPQPPSPVREDV